MLPKGWEDVRRVAAMRLDNIGDVVLLGPALRTLRDALPDAHITLMASPAGSQVAPLLPWVDAVMVERVIWQELGTTAAPDREREAKLVERLAEQRFDAAVIFTSFSQSPYPPAYAAYLAGIPIRIGQSKEFGGALLTKWVKPLPDPTHQAERNLFLLESAGFTVDDRHLELHIPNDVQQSADSLLRSHDIAPDDPFLLLAPGASCQARRYPADKYAQIASLLLKEAEIPLVLVGSNREHELVKPILRATVGERIVSLVGRTSVPQLAAVIKRAALILANDSGPMHIADAFDRPMVILYSGTEYESQWEPRKAPHTLLRRPTSCSPCYAFQCPFDMECLDFSPEEVVGTVLRLLNSRAGIALSTSLSVRSRQTEGVT